jgi:hypothetical protein
MIFATVSQAQVVAHLESPSPGSFQASGVSLIRGWVCQASRVEVRIDGGPLLVTAYGTERPDTAGVCSDTNNGFGLTYNWNVAGDGMHTLQAFADGVEFASVNFVVTTLGDEYLTGLEGEYTVPDFPALGRTTPRPACSSVRSSMRPAPPFPLAALSARILPPALRSTPAAGSI